MFGGAGERRSAHASPHGQFAHEQTFAPWTLTVMAPGGIAVAGFPARAEYPRNLQPTNPLVMWAYTDLSDARWRFLRKYISLRQDKSQRSVQRVRARVRRPCGLNRWESPTLSPRAQKLSWRRCKRSRVTITPQPDELAVTVRFFPAHDAKINSAPGRAANDPKGTVDLVRSQNIKNEADDDIPNWAFKCPNVSLRYTSPIRLPLSQAFL